MRPHWKRSGQQYLLLCPLARKREDMLSLGTLLCSAVDGHRVLEKNKGGYRETEREEKHRDTESGNETKIFVPLLACEVVQRNCSKFGEFHLLLTTLMLR